MNYKVKLTADIQQVIIAAIRQGAWLHDAFRIAGVPDHTWKAWMDPSLKRGKYFELQQAIKQAQSMARFMAALEVKKDQPFKWLANGPGRDMPGEPGWASMTTPSPPEDPGAADPMQFPEFVRFVNNVRIVMSCYPEARAMLDELQAQPTPGRLESSNPQRVSEANSEN